MPYSKDFTTLAGGRLSLAGFRISGIFHQEGQMRRNMLLDNTMALMKAAGLTTDKDLKDVANVLHTKERALGGFSAWDNAGSGNLSYSFASAYVQKEICKLAGKDVSLTPEHQAKNAESLERIRLYRQNLRAAFLS